MPYGQWLAFNADDSVHKCDGPSGYDNPASTASSRQMSTSPQIVSRPAPKPTIPKPVPQSVDGSQKTRMPPVQKQQMPAWLDMLLGIILLIIILFLFSLFSKK
jgi:hypothetical protein